MRMALADESHATAYLQKEVSIVKRSLIPSALGALLPSMPHRAALNSRSPWAASHGVHTVVDIDLAHLPKNGSSEKEGGMYEADKEYSNSQEDDEKPMAAMQTRPRTQHSAMNSERPGTAPTLSTLASSPSSPRALGSNLPSSPRAQETFAGRIVVSGLGVEDESAGNDREDGSQSHPIGRQLAAGVAIQVERVVKVEGDDTGLHK